MNDTCVIMEPKAFSKPMDGTARHNFPWKIVLKVVTNEKGEAVGEVLTIIC
jgi:hypothetical protein